MTVFALLPDHRPSFLDGNGDPASGGQLFIYSAGSTTKATTYADSDGLVANSNPITLNSRGETPSGVYVASGTYKLVYAPSGDTDPPGSAIWTRDDLSPINDTSTTVDEWVASGLTPTYLSGTQFSVPGDNTSELHVGRRVKAVVSAGTRYGVITASAFSSVTTVTISLDSGSLDAGLSSVSYGLLSATNQSLPAPIKGTDVASANALALGGGQYFDVTGTTAITSIGSKGVGARVRLHFDAALTLTHHATDLILPGSADIVTAAGDEAEFIEYAAGDWRCVSYTRAASAPSGLTRLAPVATTSGTSVDLSVAIPAWCSRITVLLNGVSTNGNSASIIQIGDSGGLETSSYVSQAQTQGGTALQATNGFLITSAQAATDVIYGRYTIEHVGSNVWVWSGQCQRDSSGSSAWATGAKTLSATLDRLSITTVGGANTLDAGSVTVLYE